MASMKRLSIVSYRFEQASVLEKGICCGELKRQAGKGGLS